MDPKMTPKPGEVWQVDLGPVAKLRPVLVLSHPGATRPLSAVVPCTATLRGGPGEVPLPAVRSNAWDKPTVANIEGLTTIEHRQFVRRRGYYEAQVLAPVRAALRAWLDL